MNASWLVSLRSAGTIRHAKTTAKTSRECKWNMWRKHLPRLSECALHQPLFESRPASCSFRGLLQCSATFTSGLSVEVRVLCLPLQRVSGAPPPYRVECFHVSVLRSKNPRRRVHEEPEGTAIFPDGWEIFSKSNIGAVEPLMILPKTFLLRARAGNH